MMDNENEENPPFKKRPRGPYRQYLLPGNSPFIPESTIRSRDAGRSGENDGVPRSSGNNTTARIHGGGVDIGCETNFADSDQPVGSVEAGVTNESRQADQASPPDSRHADGATTSDIIESRQTDQARTSYIHTGGNNEAASAEIDILQLLTSCEGTGYSDVDPSAPPTENEDTPAPGSRLLSSTGEAEATAITQSLSDIGEIIKKREAFLKRHGLEENLFPNIQTSKFEALLMILHIALRHHHTGPLVVDLIKFVNALFHEKVLSPSLYIFSKAFSTSISPLYHFLCSNCNLYLGEKTSFEGLTSVVCSHCEAECDVSDINAPGVFISLPIAKQIQCLLRRPDIKLVGDRPCSEDIRDIMDGELYKELAAKLEGSNFLTVCFNTDGVQPFEMPGKSLWPILLSVNELIPTQRLKPENAILAGLYFGRGAPDMNWFLRPVVEEFRNLSKDGVWVPNGKGQNVLFRVYVLLASLDLIAKAKVQRMKQFNGMFGCGYCLHPNFTLLNGKRVFGYHADKCYPMRANESLRSDMFKAHELSVADELTKLPETSVKGALGASPTLGFPEFDVVDGFVIDYLHNALEGVMELLVRVWTDGQYKDEEFYLAPHLNQIDKQLLSQTPPIPMSCKRLSSRAEWKAKDWRTFLLFFSLPILKKFLPERYYDHFSKFAIGIYLLLKESITKDNLQEAECLLSDFVKSFQRLYKKEPLVHNVHLLLHLPSRVSKVGPLWASSNFLFESCNGRLLKYLEGTKLAAHEIVKKHLIMQSVSECFEMCSSPIKEHVVEFCTDVCSFSRLQRAVRCADGSVLTSTRTVQNISPEEIECLKDFPNDFPPGKIVFYNRIIKNQEVFTSRCYSRLQVHDNSCVQLNDASFAVVEKIIKLSPEGEASAMIKRIRMSNRPCDHLAPHIKSCAFDMLEPLCIVPFSCILKRCVFVRVRHSDSEMLSYVCSYPNFIERE